MKSLLIWAIVFQIIVILTNFISTYYNKKVMRKVKQMRYESQKAHMDSIKISQEVTQYVNRIVARSISSHPKHYFTKN
jgi:NADH:ubiquinone oxidoreductase subunit 3 (subunit A)